MKKQVAFRRISQLIFFLTVGMISLNHYLSETGRSLPWIGDMSLHAICPFGAVEAFLALFQYEILIAKIHSSSFVLFVLIVLLSLVFGPVVCGYICPLGTVQEWVSSIGRKLLGKRHNTFVPPRVHKVLRHLRYVVLLFVVYLSTESLRLIFMEVDPYFALFNFWSDEVTLGDLLVLGLTLVSSLFIERPWCKYACPFGALVGLTSGLSIFKIRRSEKSCIHCHLCTERCPMHIDVAQQTLVTDPQCIRCGLCTSDFSCPIPQTVLLTTKKTWAVPHEEQ